MDRYRKDLTGGMPLELDDFEFDENGILDAFAGLGAVGGFPTIPDSYILNGVGTTIGGGNISVVAGWIFYNGEVVKVDAHTIVD